MTAMADWPKDAEVVVVGGGIVGASALYHLAAAGCRDAVLLERDTLGSGSTGAAAGGIRAQFSDELNIRIAVESLTRFERFADEIGADIGFRRSGYLFLLPADAVADFEAAVALQATLGVPTRMITPDEAAALVPQLSLDGIAAATFNPTDASADPGAAVQGYVDAARRHGAAVFQGVTADRVLHEGGRVVGVATSRGTIATSRMICAAGVWSAELAATAGVSLPVQAERRYVFQTAGEDDLPADLPLTIDFATGFYLHRERHRLLLGGPWATAEELAPIALARVPALADMPIRAGWSGLYEMSPDHNAIVGAATDPAGFLYATGFSGHGFQQSPVVGRYLAEVALGADPSFDLSAFSVERFSTGTLRRERNVV
jgi:sarcosine oxidase subunit beta